MLCPSPSDECAISARIPRLGFWLRALFAVGVLAVVEVGLAAQQAEIEYFAVYPGSRLEHRKLEPEGRYSLVLGVSAESFEARDLTGRVQHFYYYNPSDRATETLFEHYLDALRDAGFEVAFTCIDRACGPSYAADRWARFNGIEARRGAIGRYVAARRTRPEGTVWVALMVGQHRTQVDVIERRGSETQATNLETRLHQAGRWLLGVSFEPGSAQADRLAAGSLEALAALARSRPDWRLFVVGHADATESDAEALSVARARWVADQLVRTMPEWAGRLEAVGAAAWAPMAGSATAAGRAENRRVELVLRGTGAS